MSEIRSQATPARDELAADIRTRYEQCGAVDRDPTEESLADHLIAKGWSKPRTVNSETELDALPHESVIRDSLGDVYEKWSPPDESMTEWMTPGTSWTPAPTLPATVLFTPGDAG